MMRMMPIMYEASKGVNAYKSDWYLKGSKQEEAQFAGKF